MCIERRRLNFILTKTRVVSEVSASTENTQPLENAPQTDSNSQDRDNWLHIVCVNFLIVKITESQPWNFVFNLRQELCNL